MRSNIFQRNLALLVAVFFVTTLCVQERALAFGIGRNDNKPEKIAKIDKWRNNAPKSSSLTPILIVGAAVIGTFIIIKALKKGNQDDKKDEGKEKDESKASADLYNYSSITELSEKFDFSSTADLKIQPYFALGSFNNTGKDGPKATGRSFQFGILMNF